MIKSMACDVEVFRNLFSVTFVDLKDYLRIFKDCGKDPLTDHYSVKEIKEKLDSVKKHIFYISDTNDSQLLKMIGFFNQMEPHEEEVSPGVKDVVRYDLYGYNFLAYDNLMIQYFLMYWNQYKTTKELCKKLYDFSKKVISMQSDKDRLYNDNEINFVKSYPLPYLTVDLYKLFGLNATTVTINSQTGERQKFGKSLKQTSINLKWHELLDFKLPPIDEGEHEFYPEFATYSLDEINILLNEDFDRYVMPKYVDDMLYYNTNDSYLCCELVRQCKDEVQLRYSLSKAFNLQLHSCSRSNIADKLLVKYYSEMTGLQAKDFKDLRTERTALSFKKIIFPHIEFKTPQLRALLEEMKHVVIYHTNKDAFSRTFEFYGTTYTLATGGIHTKDSPGIYKSDDKYVYRHHDYTSYYPSIMISYKIIPKHIHNVFTKMIAYFKDTRVKCKHTDDSVELIIKGVPNKLSAEALKIVINAIYGKLGSDKFWLYDRFAQMQVTINGQLMTMTLVEELELNGIHVISANTDGIIIKLPRDKENVYKEITDRWNEKNKMGADYEDYKYLVVRDVNNYFNLQYTKSGEDKFEGHGVLDPKQYIKNVGKGFDMPVVTIAVIEYFINNTPVMETLKNHKNILDFCKTQNIGRQFEVIYTVIKNGVPIVKRSQRHVRFYVSTHGVVIQKEHVVTKARNKLASGLPVKVLNSLDDLPIEERDIDYKYYYDEAYKIINPIMLRISSSQKGNAKKGTRSGKVLIKQYAQQYNTLFDDIEND